MQKRPLYAVLLVFILGMAGSLLPFFLLLLSGIVLSILLLYLTVVKQKWKATIIFLLVFSAGFARMEKARETPAVSSGMEEGQNTCITGQVYKREQKQNDYIYYLKNTSIYNQNNASVGRIIVYPNSNQILKIGQVVKMKGELHSFSGARNPGGFDTKGYYRAMGIHAYFYENATEWTGKEYNHYTEQLARIREQIGQVFRDALEEKEASILNAMILGAKRELDEETKALYQRNGISHLLAISGLHISFLGYSLFGVLKKGGLGQRGAVTVGIFIMGSYGILTGLSTSALRALLMFITALTAKILGRTYDIGSALTLAALVVLFDQPLMLGQAGCLLSFGAVAGIIFILPELQRLCKKKNAVLDSLLTSISVNLMILPVLFYFYYEFAIYSIILNLLVIPLAGLLVGAGAVGGISGIYAVKLGNFLLGTCHYILLLYEKLCLLFDRIPNGMLVVGQPGVKQMLGYYLLLIMMLAGIRYKPGKQWLLLIVAAVWILPYRPPTGLEVTMIDVGQGDSIFLREQNGAAFLIDGGSSDVKRVGTYRILPFLKARGVGQLDYMVMTHGDEDHLNGLLELMEAADKGGVKIKNVLLPKLKEKDDGYRKVETCAEKYNITVTYIEQGDSLKAGNLKLQCLHPNEEEIYPNKNGGSLVFSLQYKKFQMLLTGDLEEEQERSLIAKGSWKDCDVLKAAHHGSKYSTTKDFLEQAKPEVVFISCGINNRYGHPHEELLERLEDAVCQILSTDQCGAITLYSDGQTYRWSTFLL